MPTLIRCYWPEDISPIVYLPGIRRPQLRAVENFPADLQPLAALQYRGAFFSHANGKDWSISAFLQSDKLGLELDIARDSSTHDALKTALVEFVDIEVDKLTGKQLSADDFHALVAPEPDRMILQWLNDPAATKEQWGKSRWKTFRSTCKKQYDFDPEADGELGGAELLGLRQKKWETVWQRFADGPGPYPNVPDRLRAARPKTNGLFDLSESWPQDNEQMEQELQQVLQNIKTMPAAEVHAKLAKLEHRHGQRRGWLALERVAAGDADRQACPVAGSRPAHWHGGRRRLLPGPGRRRKEADE